MIGVVWALVNTALGRALILAALIGVALGWYTIHTRNQAVLAERARIQAEEQKRVQKSIDADDSAKRCALDPRCRLLSDGWRRD